MVDSKGLVVLNDSTIEFEKDEIKHTSRRIEYWQEKKKQATVLLTNNFDLDPDEIIEIYRRRWQIELLFKQLKQNFPLKYFFGESVNAIQSQIWVALIANLLLTVVEKRVKRDWSFSNLVTMVRQTLMYYIDLYQFCENPENAWLKIISQRNLPPPEPTLFDSGGLLLKNLAKMTTQYILARQIMVILFLPDSNISIYIKKQWRFIMYGPPLFCFGDLFVAARIDSFLLGFATGSSYWTVLKELGVEDNFNAQLFWYIHPPR